MKQNAAVNVGGWPLPSAIVSAIQDGTWPLGRVDTAPLAEISPTLARLDLLFNATVADFEKELANLAHLPVNPSDLHDMFRFRRGSEEADAVELPLLDIEKVVPFGGGAELGDDTWLMLDYRTDPTDPRVVTNEYQHHLPRPAHCLWREVTPTFTEFCRVMRTDCRTWPSADPEPLAPEFVEALRRLGGIDEPDVRVWYVPAGVAAHEISGSVRIQRDDKEEEFRPGDPLKPPCVLKIAAGTRLSFSRGPKVGTATTHAKPLWAEVRSGRWPRDFKVRDPLSSAPIIDTPFSILSWARQGKKRKRRRTP